MAAVKNIVVETCWNFYVFAVSFVCDSLSVIYFVVLVFYFFCAGLQFDPVPEDHTDRDEWLARTRRQ